MKANAQRFAESRILVEQLRLVLGNVGSTVAPICLLAVLVLFSLSNDSNATALRTWCAGAILANLFAFHYARKHLTGITRIRLAHRIVWALVAQRAVSGVIWGALVWITFDTASLAGRILAIAVIAGMAGGAVSTQSAVLPVFFAFVVPAVSIVALKLWLTDDSAYHALGLVCLLYLVSLVDQARSSARAARTTIELRFENTELMEKLRRETLVAQGARREAEHSNAAKSKFLAAASHDLRQPIHAQGLFLDVLSRTELSPHQRELVACVGSASHASAEMLNTLLDFSRIEAGVIEPQQRAFRLQPLLNKIEREFEPQADARGLSYRSRENTWAVLSDPALVELILRNLVANAINYTRHGGLLVACRKRGGHAVLEVWDTGIGIEASQQGEVFREFHQLGNPERDRHKGLGLGLAIADGLARTLGHGLSLASTLHRGSVFRLVLPITDTLPIEASSVEHGKPQMLGARALVIDDDETVRTAMLHLLRDWGCECEAAESIEQALVLATQQAPDLVISDYRLREKRTGIEAIAALRALLGNDLPALLITGDTAPDRLREAKASGIALLHKPITPSHLYRALVTILPP
ncbi:Signal transduction histidine kinase [Polaromonas sp. OV174]|uniref:ATP-binding response regulator n=1 Tax=Polaromonas sp. OV174 TaxID=1855300 RepID=UPI0008EA5D50|nr:ATP-binding protein [Polaromonas sp. OV174]SFC45813.1 Signal transduction histidine kinase [Polaromonas sp. OV174]